jgi:hypothetical protein
LYEWRGKEFHRSMRRMLASTLLALAIGALTLYTYRELPARLFAADDYQWLLNVRGLSFGQLVRHAFDARGQTHFYRPLVWLLFWVQVRAFDLDPRGYHAVSLALHLLNAFLLGWLGFRLTKDEGRRTKDRIRHHSSFVFRLSSAALAACIVALHPAPFEAVVWISAQSELLAAALLLIALHVWLSRRPTPVLPLDPSTELRAGTLGNRGAEGTDDRRLTADSASTIKRRPPTWSVVGGQWSLLATVVLGLALLAKESAVVGLPLLLILGQSATGDVRWASRKKPIADRLSPIAPYLLPGLLTVGYIALQVIVEQRNYLLQQGGYGVGWQIVLNPLRSLALIVAPLAGTEHADAAWLVPAGALVTLALLIILVRGPWGARWLVLALGLTLLPTAPFAAPPNSRYLYLPVMAAALLLSAGLARLQRYAPEVDSPNYQDAKPSSFSVLHNLGALVPWWLIIALALSAGLWIRAAAGELHDREWRFAAGAGPGGSLWRLADSLCHERRPDRMIVVEPPVAGPVVDAIIHLSCGAKVRSMIVGRDQVAGAIKGTSVVISFPNGSATVESTTWKRHPPSAYAKTISNDMDWPVSQAFAYASAESCDWTVFSASSTLACSPRSAWLYTCARRVAAAPNRVRARSMAPSVTSTSAVACKQTSNSRCISPFHRASGKVFSRGT